MDKIEEKLHLFSKNCNWLAEEEKERLESQIKEQVNQSIATELKQYEEKLEKKEKEKEVQLEKAYYRKIWELENENKKKLMFTEEKQMEQLKQILIEKLNQFVESEKYKSYLIQNIKQVIRTSCEKRENNSCSNKKRYSKI